MVNKSFKINYVAGCFHQMISIRVLFLMIGVMICICLDTWDQIPFLWSAKITVYYYLFNSIAYGGTYMPYLMPVFATCAYSASYVKETSGGMKQYLIGRVGYGGYAAGKIIVSVVGGGMVAAAGTVLFCVAAGCLQPLYEWEEGVNTLYYTQPDNSHGILYICILVYVTMLKGMFWSMFSLLCSSYLENVYAVIASPLLGSYLLTRIYIQLGVPDPYRLDHWLSARAGIGSDKEMLILTTIRVMLWILIMAALFYKRMKYRQK